VRTIGMDAKNMAKPPRYGIGLECFFNPVGLSIIFNFKAKYLLIGVKIKLNKKETTGIRIKYVIL